MFSLEAQEKVLQSIFLYTKKCFHQIRLLEIANSKLKNREVSTLIYDFRATEVFDNYVIEKLRTRKRVACFLENYFSFKGTSAGEKVVSV